MNVAFRNAPLGQTLYERGHHGGRAADIKDVASMRQDMSQQGEVDQSRLLKVLALDIARSWQAVCDNELESRMERGKMRQVRLEGMVDAAVHAIEEGQSPCWLMGERPGNHADHGRHADTASNKHRGHIGLDVQHKLPGRSLHLQNVTNLYRVVQEGRGRTRRQVHPARGGGNALDRDPVCFRVWLIRERIAAHEGPPGPGPG